MTEPATRAAVTVRMPAAVPSGLAALVTAAGVGVGFVAAPLVRWLLSTAAGAPGLLRLLATLPTGWAVLVTGLIGLVAGMVLAGAAQSESPEVTVCGDHVQLGEKGRDRWIDGAEIRGVLRDGRDLVLLDGRGAELDRLEASDLPARRLRAAFAEHNYPWCEDAGYGAGFSVWADGRPDVPVDARPPARAQWRIRAEGGGRRGRPAVAAAGARRRRPGPGREAGDSHCTVTPPPPSWAQDPASCGLGAFR